MNDFRTMDQGSEGDTQGAEDPAMERRRSSLGEMLGESDASRAMYKSLELEGKERWVCARERTGKLQYHKDGNSLPISL